MKPVPIEDFGAHVQRMHADRDRWFELEYNVSTRKHKKLSAIHYKHNNSPS